MARAPGRLDVMGGIADYSGSLVLLVNLPSSPRPILDSSFLFIFNRSFFFFLLLFRCQQERRAMQLSRGIILANRNSGSTPKQDFIQETLPYLKLYVLFYSDTTFPFLSLKLVSETLGFIWIGVEQ